MKITITASLTDEQALILAKRMWYSEEIIWAILDEETWLSSNGMIKNPQTPFDFIKNVYEQMVANDAARHFIAYNDEKNQAIWEEEDQTIKQEVFSSITSKVE